MKTAVEEEAYGVENMAANKPVQFKVCQSDSGIEATLRSITYTDRIVHQLEREINGITL